MSNLRGNSVSVIDTATNTVTTTVPVGRFPEGIAVTPDGSTVLVVNDGDNNVSVIATATNTVTGTIAVVSLPGPVAITPDGTTAYVGGGGATPVVMPIDVATSTTGATIPASNQPFSIAIMPDGTTGYVANFVGGSVTVFDVATNTADDDDLRPAVPHPHGDRDHAGRLVRLRRRLQRQHSHPDRHRHEHARRRRSRASPGRRALRSRRTSRRRRRSRRRPPGPGHASSFDASASTDPDGTVASYVWDFGDGSPAATATTPTTTHTYAAAGTYTVTLTEVDDEGCSTARVFTGSTASCNGSSVAAVSHDVTVSDPPELSLTYGAASVPLHGSTPLTVELSNPNAAATLTGVGFDDALPAGLQIATPNGLTGACSNGTISATAGGAHLTVSGATLAAGASCTFSVDVTGVVGGSWVSMATPTANETGDGAPVSPRLDVVAPPVVAPGFGTASTTVGAATSLTLAITNPNASFALAGVGLSLTLPSGLVVATPNGLTGSCGGGTITAAAASTTVALAGATLPGGAGCSFSVQVEAVAVGGQHVSVAAGSDNGGSRSRAHGGPERRPRTVDDDAGGLPRERRLGRPRDLQRDRRHAGRPAADGHGELLRRRREHPRSDGVLERRRRQLHHVEPDQRHALDGGPLRRRRELRAVELERELGDDRGSAQPATRAACAHRRPWHLRRPRRGPHSCSATSHSITAASRGSRSRSPRRRPPR